MLKGHATIELTDVHTGKKEVVGHDNLITNAVSNHMNKVIQLIPSLSDFGNYFTPLYDAGMGGILLFENQLEVSADNTEFPYGNGLTGYASNNANDTTDIRRGSKNLTESMKLSNGYKYVWDFATSQANGTISALALTNKLGGVYGENTFSMIYDTRIQTSFSNTTYYDFVNDVIHVLTVESTSTSDMLKFTLKKYKVATHNLSITDTFGSYSLLSTVTINVRGMPTSYYTYRTAKYGNYYYVVLYTSTSSGYGEYLLRLNIDTLEYDSSFGVNKICTAYNYSYCSQIAICDGYLYQIVCVASGLDLQLMKVKLSDISNIEYIDVSMPSNYYYNTFLTEICNGVLIWQGGYYFTNSNTFLNKNVNIYTGSRYYLSNIHFSRDGLFFMGYSDNYYRFGHTGNYLASINNLDSPVTKTPDKTMKITYTVTET